VADNESSTSAASTPQAAPDAREARRSEFESARKAAKKLLNTLEIERVWVIDDHAIPGPEAFLAAYQSSREKAPLPAGDIAWAELDDDEWRHEVRSWFDELDDSERRKVNRKALKALGTEPLSSVDLDLLQQLLGVDTTTLLHPDEWDEQRDQLIDQVGDPKKVLVLFDRNLGPGRPNGGVTYLKRYLAGNSAARAAILTDTVTPDEELSEVKTLTGSDEEIYPRTLLSSKKNLTVSGAMAFLNLLRLTANAPNLDAMRTRFLDSFDEHHVAAKARLTGLNARILEDIVMRSSQAEGAWELDTLLRLMALFQDDAMRESLRDEGEDGGVRSLLALARRLVDMCFVEHPPSVAEAKKIMAGERWARIDYVNELGLPLANGDVFTIANRSYILMCQPCDLMLRSNGRRRASSTVTLLPLEPKGSAVDGESSSAEQERSPASVLENKRRYHDLPFGLAGEPPEGIAMVFAPWFDVETFVLDLCTFRVDGNALLETDGQGAAPEPLTPGVRARRSQVVKEAVQKLKLVGECAALDDEPRRKLTAELLSPDHAGLIKPNLRKVRATQLAYDCQRVARLASPFAEAALTALTAERAREAHEHDLDKFGNPVGHASAA
jgi:hypothetical protein